MWGHLKSLIKIKKALALLEVEEEVKDGSNFELSLGGIQRKFTKRKECQRQDDILGRG